MIGGRFQSRERQKPRAARFVIHRDVVSGTVPIELFRRVNVSPNGLRLFARFGVRTDGQVAVKDEVGEVFIQFGVDACSIEFRVERVIEPHSGRRFQDQRIQVVPGARIDVIERIGATHVHAVRRQALQSPIRVLLNDLCLQGVAGHRGVGAFVTPSVVVRIHQTIAPAHAQGVELIAIAIAIAFRNLGATACVDFTGSVAHPARIQGANAFIDVVAHAISVLVRLARATAHTGRIEHVAFAVACAVRNGFAKRGVRGASRSFSVVVARLGVVTPRARHKLARPIVEVGL